MLAFIPLVYITELVYFTEEKVRDIIVIVFLDHDSLRRGIYGHNLG